MWYTILNIGKIYSEVNKMLERQEAVKAIHKGCVEKFEALGFSFAGISEDESGVCADFTKGNLTVRLLSHDNLLDMLEKISDEENEGEFKKVSVNLLELDDCDEKSLKSLCNEINDSIAESYGKKAVKAAAKAPATVSRAAVRAGMTYDANTLANKILLVYPDLKGEYKANIEKYGEFLSDEFFTEHGNQYILSTIRSGDAQTRKKLFKILVDMYQDGSSETQNLICVTILGEMNNDADMMAVCRSYIEDDEFYETLKAVNELLASGTGRKLREKLKNPPKYKPEKKKGGMMGNMLDASAAQQQK